MALKLQLKANERVLIGGAVVKNGSKLAEIFIENNVPILREKDIMTEEQAVSPCRRVYLAIQLMYIDEKNLSDYHKAYWDLVGELVKAAPSMLALIDATSELIVNGKYYQALKQARKLIDYEEELLRHARQSY